MKGQLLKCETTYTSHTIKAGIERGDPPDAAIQHNGRVHGIASGQALMLHQEVARTIRIRKRDIEDLRTNGYKRS